MLLLLKNVFDFPLAPSRLNHFNCFQTGSLRAQLSTTNWGVESFFFHSVTTKAPQLPPSIPHTPHRRTNMHTFANAFTFDNLQSFSHFSCDPGIHIASSSSQGHTAQLLLWIHSLSCFFFPSYHLVLFVFFENNGDKIQRYKGKV